MNKIKLFDSFAGIGALHKGLTNLDIPTKLVGVSEIDKDAILSYGAIHNIDITDIEIPSKEEMITYLENKNIGYDFKKKKHSIKRMSENKINLLYKYTVAMNNFGDISLIDPYQLPDFDLFNFSFPCTNISVAGKQEGMIKKDGGVTSSGLYIYGINIIKVKKPKYIMIENVKNLIGKKFINDFYNIINELEDTGYNCYYPKNKKDKPMCLNAKDFGIPQNRERVFVICIRKDIDNEKFEFPIGRDYGVRLKDVLENEVDEKYYLSDEYMNRFLESLNSEKMQDKLPKSGAYEVIGTTVNPEAKGTNSRHWVYNIEGNISTIDATTYKQPKQILEENNIQQIGMLDIKGNEQVRRVYSDEGISPTLNTMQGGNRQPKILEENHRILEIGKLNPNRHSSAQNSVLDSDGICPTIDTMGGGNREPKVIEKIICEQRSDEGLRFFKGDYCGTLKTIDACGDKRVIETTDKIKIPQATKQGYIEMSVPGVCDLSYPNSKTRRGRVQNNGQTCPTLTAAVQNIVNIDKDFRIRKLTPLECWRLMGFNDEDFYKAKEIGISNSQLYRQAGNSIVVNVLVAIFKNLFTYK